MMDINQEILQILGEAMSPAAVTKGLSERELLLGTSFPILHVLSLFNFGHLPPSLQYTSRKFAELAATVASETSNIETTVALRKLLEAKDAAVRATLIQE